MERKDPPGTIQRIRDDAVTQRRSASDVNMKARDDLRSVADQIEAIGRGDLEAALANAAPDVELETFAPPEFKWISYARGVNELRAALAKNFGSLQNQSRAILNVVAQGDTLVLMGRETGRIRGTGEPYDIEFVEKFLFEEGRLIALRIVAARFAD